MTVLLFGVLMLMTGRTWLCAFVAALFALHPFHVESVVWVSQRKDVLSTFFWLATMGAYARYAGRVPGSGFRVPGWYVVALVCFTSISVLLKKANSR